MAEHTHVGVYGVLVRNGRLLLIRKGRGPYLGKLDLPGGKVEAGETPEEALHREVMEETGISVIDMELLRTESKTTSYFQDDQQMSMNHIGTLYRVVAFDDSKFDKSIQLEDVKGVDWYDLATLKLTELTPFAESVVRELA